jgi:hypothetical protein
MLKAYEAVKTGVPVQRAAKQFGIPEQTLRDRVKGYVDPNSCSSGGETFFSKEEEETLVDHVETLSQLGYGYSNTQLQHLAGEMAFDLGKKSRNKAMSNNWLYGFLRRWNSRLASFTPRKLESSRAKYATPETVSSYFGNLKDVMVKYDLLNKPQFIYNIDETGLQPEHRPPNVIAGVNSKPQAVTSPRSTTTTLIGCVNAIGNSLPPYFVFKGKRFNPDLMKGKSAGAAGTVSDSGWSNAKVFRSYLDDHFLPNVRPFAGNDQHILLIFDGHASHFTPELITWAKSHNIILFVLPAHTSHLLQPLDVAIFGPFKSFYYTECSNFMRNNIGQTITRYDMCEIACKAYLKSMTPVNVQSGFRKTGIYPLSEEAVSREKLFPCESFRENEPIEKIKAIKSGKEAVDQFLKFKMEKRTEQIEYKQCSKCRCSEKPRPGGKAITEEQFLTCLADYDKTKESQATTEVKRSKKSKACPPKSNKNSPRPSTSGIGKFIYLESEDEEEEESNCNEEDLCCVCMKMSPPSLKDSLDLKIVNWAKCDKCSHWVHLAFCSTVRVVRRHSSFVCPHCEIQANTKI